MLLIFEDNRKRVIKTKEEIKFSSSSGFHLIQITARAKGEKISDSAHGATHFHSFTDPKEFPSWATKDKFKIKLGDIYFYELES